LTTIETTLSQATDEEEILTAMTFALEDELEVTGWLQYIETDERDRPVSLHTVKVWHDGLIQDDHPLLHQRQNVKDSALSELWISAKSNLLFISDVNQDDQLTENMRRELTNIGAATFIPLWSSGRWQGLIVFTWPDAHIFSDNELFCLRRLSEPLAAVVAGRRATLRQQDALSSMEILYSASRRLNETRDLQQIVATVVEGGRISAINRAVLLLFEYSVTGTVNNLQVVANWHSGDGALPIPIGTEYSRRMLPTLEIVFTDEPVFFDDVQRDSRVESAVAEFCKRENIVALAVLPLWGRPHQLGVLMLQAEETHHFTEQEIQPYVALTGQMAVAIENTRLLEKAQQRAELLEKLTQIESALSLVITEEDIVDSISVATQGIPLPVIILSYLETDENGWPITMQPMAMWSDNLASDISAFEQIYDVNDFPMTKSWTNHPERVFYVESLEDDSLFDERTRQLIAKFDFQAMAVLPLFVGGHWQGMVSYTWSEPHVFSDEEQFIFQKLLEPVGAVVSSRRAQLAQQKALAENRDLLEQAQRRVELEQQVRTITDKIRRALDQKTILQIARQELGQLLGASHTSAKLGTREQLLEKLTGK
jgi:GAF domain-containing protein